MIIIRSPLRISLAGGATDLPSFYKKEGGFCVSAAINKYVFVTINRPFQPGIYLKYSELEHVETAEQIKHPIFRECLKMMNLSTPQIEIASLTDIPAGTGLGSSSVFTVALLKALYSYKNIPISQIELAQMACEVELNRLKEPIGRQDQFASSIGGLTCFQFNQDETVHIAPLNTTYENKRELEDSLMLFFVGFERSSSKILLDQDSRTKNNDQAMMDNLLETKKIGLRMKSALEQGDIKSFGELTHEHWVNKKSRSPGISNPQIDEWYDLGLRSGAWGGKLVGGGGGGFLMFVAKDRSKLRKTMLYAGLQEVRFSFDYEGVKQIL